jgi:hypothetical protein
VAGQLAPAGIDDEIVDSGQSWTGDEQHIRSMNSEGASAYRPCNHSREVEHAHAAKRSVVGGQGPRLALADLLDGHERFHRDRLRLLVLIPLGE